MPRASKARPGRPSNDSSRRSIAASAREYGPEALEVLASVMRDSDAAPGARVDAATKLLDRGFGRPTEHHQRANVDGAFSDLSDNELADALTLLRAELAVASEARAGAEESQGSRKPH